MVISSRMDPNFVGHVVFGTCVFPDLIISGRWYQILMQCTLQLIIFLVSVMCSVYSKLCSSSAFICSFFGNVEKDFPCLDR